VFKSIAIYFHFTKPNLFIPIVAFYFIIDTKK